MSEPKQEIVREIAQQVADIALHDAVHVDQWIGAVISNKLGNECSQVKVKYHIAVERRMAVVKPSWPDEQQPAEATGGEQAQDGSDEAADAAARLRAWFKAEGPLVMDEADFNDVQAVLADYKQLAAEAELARVNRRADFLEATSDGLRQQAIEAVKARNEATARAESATVLPERWRALIAERDAARKLARVSLDILRNVSDEPMRELFEVDDMDELPDWFTGYGKPSAARAPDAAQEARSATLRAEDASGGAFQANTSSILPQGLSEPELFADACDCECQPGQPCLCPERDCYCGPCRVCGDNPQQPNDTTEDDRG